MHRPQSPAAWTAVAAVPVALVGLLLTVWGIATDSDWWLLGTGLTSLATVVSAVALFRIQTQER